MNLIRKYLYCIFILFLYVFYSFKCLAYNKDFTPVGNIDEEKTVTEKLAFYDKWLPFFGQRLRAKGIELPLPFSVGVNYLTADINTNLVNFQDSHGNSPLQPASYISFDPNTKLSIASKQVQLSAWVFPFLNFFAIAGQTNIDGDIGININQEEAIAFLFPTTPDLCKTLPPKLKPKYCGQVSHLLVDSHTSSALYSFGAIIATDYKNFMIAAPISYTFSQFSLSDKPTTNINITPRVGYHFRSPTYGMLTPFIGGTYQYSKINISGSTDDVPVLGVLNYSISSKSDNYYSAVLGAIWMPRKRLSFDVEYNIGPSRETFMVNTMFNF